MGAASDPRRYELHVLRAPGDGVEPAILLKAPGRRAEYLFNVPEGFSRLALEHKSIPSGRLSCVLLSSLLPGSIGGLGGLMLRLKQDGHGQVQVVGPRGSSQVVHSLRHICRWRHPRVIVSECREDRPAPVFVDEFVAIVPLVAGDGSAACPWCACPPVSAQAKKISDSVLKGCDGSTSSSDDDSSSSGSEGAESPSRDGDAAMARFLQSGLSNANAEESFEKRLGKFSSSTHGGGGGHGIFSSVSAPGCECAAGSDFDVASAVREVNSTGDRTSDGYEFCGSLRAEMESGNGGEDGCEVSTLRNLIETSDVSEEGIGKRKRLKVTPRLSNGAYLAGSGGGQDCNSPSLLDNCCRGGVGSGRSPEDNSPNVSWVDNHQATSKAAGEGTLDNWKSSATGATGAIGYSASEDLSCVTAPGRGTIDNALTGITDQISSVRTAKPFEWEIRNSQLFELPEISDELNPVVEYSPSGKVSVISSPDVSEYLVFKDTEGPNPCRTSPGTVLGFVCYLRKLDEAIIFVTCGDVNYLESLWRHPALACVHFSAGGCAEAGIESKKRKHNVGAVVHLSPDSVLQSSEYKPWMHSFKSSVHVMANDSSSEFGFQSSLATLKKLNSLDSSFFPLPRNFLCKQEFKDLPGKDLDRRSVSFVSARLGTNLTFDPEGCSVSGSSVDGEEMKRSVGQADECSLGLGSTGVQQLNGVSGPPSVSNPKNNPSRCCWSSGDEKSPSGVAELRPTSNLECGPPSNAMTEASIDESERNACSSVSSSFGGNDDASAALGNGQSSSCVYRRLHGKIEVANLEKQGSPATDTDSRFSSPEDVGAKLDDSASEFQLTFLGTGCAEPSKKRGSSGILLQVRDARGSILLDAGEGTVGQLRRRFGGTRISSVISSLQAVWLSHKHGDHVLGALSILHERSIHAPPLIIFGPEKVRNWLSELWKVWISAGLFIAPFQFVHCEELSGGETVSTPNSGLFLDFLDAMRLKSMKSVRVHHCYEAYGLVVKGRLGWSVVYSGDTRPCRQLIESGRSCTLLIHEATFEDPLIEQARQKRHSTVSEARQVGLQMAASHIILTHFSQRYPEMVAIDGPQHQNVALAFDGMVAPSGLLGSLSTSLPLIREALQKATDGPRAGEGSDGRLPSKPVLSRSGVDGGVSSRDLNAVKAASYRKPSTSSQHKRWLSDSDEEMNDDFVASSIKWGSDSEEEASSQGRRGPIKREPLFQNTSHGCARDAGMILHCKVVDDNGLGVKNGYWRKNGGSICVPGVSEACGPFGSKHLRWNDSDCSGPDS